MKREDVKRSADYPGEKKRTYSKPVLILHEKLKNVTAGNGSE